MADIPIGVVTISDRASRGVYEDKGGPGIEAALKELLATPWRPERRIVPDERPAIEAALIALADEALCSLILTTGGTGPALRDVTPEATEAVCDRMLPGFGELMRLKSLAEVPTAILSRQVAGTRGSSLIINLPASPRRSAPVSTRCSPRCPIASTLLAARAWRQIRGSAGPSDPRGETRLWVFLPSCHGSFIRDDLRENR